MYIPQVQVPGETSVADANFLNTQATKATKGCNTAATIVLFCIGIRAFKKDSHNMCCHPGAMLNTEDTKLNKSPSCAQNPTIYFGGRNQTHHFVGRNMSFQTAQMKQQFQQKMGFGSLRDGLLVSGTVRLDQVALVVSNSLQPYEMQPTRLLCPWDSTGKNTGLGCHDLLQQIFPNPGKVNRQLITL